MDKTPHTSLAGRRVLVTGGTTGIGRATFLALAAEGARLFTFGREADPLAETLEEAGLRPEAGITADVSRAEDVAKVFEAVDRQLGGLDVVICNAAVGAEALGEMTDQGWRYAVETNFLGTLACTRAALDRMKAQGSGHVVLIGSISSEHRSAGESVYSATKAALDAFAEALRKEVAEDDIRVTMIQPGSVGSDMQSFTSEEQLEEIAAGRMLFAEEVAEAILFTLDRASRCDIAELRIEPVRQKVG